MKKLSHINENGEANMVDVGHKPEQKRKAIAEGRILLQEQTCRLIEENAMKKGDVLRIAEFAGIQAAKQTSSLIPLCHQINLTKIDVIATLESGGVHVMATAKCIGKTGVEMEALTAVQIALLTVYDMCKAADKSMEISQVRLIEKTKE